MTNIENINAIVDLADRLLTTARADSNKFTLTVSVGGSSFEAVLPESEQIIKKQQFNADLNRLKELAGEVKEF